VPAVHIVSLGCARNDVDSEELAARLDDGGFTLTGEPGDADLVVVNTCGFIAQAKKDSIDTLLAATDLAEGGRVKAVVAVGCLAERYGAELAAELPETTVLSFDDYPDIAARLHAVLRGETIAAHVPVDRRTMLPAAPAFRPQAASGVVVPGHHATGLAGGSAVAGAVLRRRLGEGPSAPLKIASGCDRRCAFCAIPSFRGSYLSRPLDEIVAEARWLVERGVKEVVLVSESSSSYGKDLGGGHGLETVLRALNGVDGLEWIRVSYLQPAELRASLIDAMTSLPHVVPYFDLPFQHTSARILRRMRRFGDADMFWTLLESIRQRCPSAGVRTNVIVGFPGETPEELEDMAGFLSVARLDAIGVFGYSDEDGTEAVELDGHLDDDEIDERVSYLAGVADDAMDNRAAERVGERVRLLVEGHTQYGVVGRAAHQAPEVDGTTSIGVVQARIGDAKVPIGAMLEGIVTASDGVDLIAREE